ncbi:unnamed protein product [Macrosiphum euphorbiae]|uniref:Uncharacterized protein n=1 Tax=Macrosiphum euphorbiae TaxID=13131 RepID=A0AAV0WGL0_9HEMI|nr:unnamed protein product [Macrosiphum euphorbiae]
MLYLPIHFITQRGVFDYGGCYREERKMSSHKIKSIISSVNNELHPFNYNINNSLKVPLEVRLEAVWNFSELENLSHACRIIRSEN